MPNEIKNLAAQIKSKSKKARSLAELYRTDPRKACKSAIAHTRKLREQDRIEVINELLEMHGTEAIRGEWQNGYWCDVVAVYCNTGDTYLLTVIQIRGEYSFQSSKFIVSSWGDWFEANERKLALQ